MEQETRDVLIAICETLRAEFVYLGALQNSHVRFYDAVKKKIPEIEQYYRDLPMTTIAEHPKTAEQIQLIDALLKKLRTP
jgi:hypothetical protein